MPTDALIYHITTPAQWQKFSFLDFYEAPSLQEEGFIHASKAGQLQATAERYYNNEPEIVLLTVNVTLLSAALVYEEAPNRKEEFPHIYGKLNKSAILETQTIARQADGFHLSV